MANENPLMEATKRFSITDSSSPRMTNYLKGILTSGEGNPMAKLDSFVKANTALTGPLMQMISKASLPVISTEDLDAQIKAIDEQITSFNTQADEASKAIDEQIKALEAKRGEARKPFTDQIEAVSKTRTEHVTALNQRLEPLNQAIDKLKGELLAKAEDILVGKVLKGDDAKAQTNEFLNVILSIDRPSVVGAPAASATSSATGASRGRAGANKVRISKNGETHEFNSFNAARAFVFTKVNPGKEVTGANAAACEKYLINQGWKVEHIQ